MFPRLRSPTGVQTLCTSLEGQEREVCTDKFWTVWSEGPRDEELADSGNVDCGNKCDEVTNSQVSIDVKNIPSLIITLGSILYLSTIE